MTKNPKIPTRPTKGMRDFFPGDHRRRRWLFEVWREIACRYGYEQYDAPVLESEELYIRKAGDEITQQLYNFEDKGGRRLALRPEMTPTLARMLMAQGGSLSLPARWWSIPQCFRYERTQKGRTREHFQWNMDIVGLASMAAEVELMAAQFDFLERVGFCCRGEKPEVEFRVSNRQVLEHFLSERGVSGPEFEAVCIIVDKRDKIGDEATGNLLRDSGVSDEVIAGLLELLNVRGLSALESVVGAENPGLAELRELMGFAEASGIGEVIEINLSVVRGLSYYTGTVWELFDTAGGVARAIAGGGRYDRLMASLGGPDLPMVGFGFGDVVIGLLLEERGLYPEPEPRVDDVVYPLTAGQFGAANGIATKLRAEGRRVLVDYSERRFKHVIKNAESVGATRLFTLGPDEHAAGEVRVRTLGEDRDEQVSKLDDWIG